LTPACTDRSVHGDRYDPARKCLVANQRMQGAESHDSAEGAIRQQCFKRVSDGTLFTMDGGPIPSTSDAWTDCSKAEQRRVTTAPKCSPAGKR